MEEHITLDWNISTHLLMQAVCLFEWGAYCKKGPNTGTYFRLGA